MGFEFCAGEAVARVMHRDRASNGSVHGNFGRRVVLKTCTKARGIAAGPPGLHCTLKLAVEGV